MYFSQYQENFKLFKLIKQPNSHHFIAKTGLVSNINHHLIKLGQVNNLDLHRLYLSLIHIQMCIRDRTQAYSFTEESKQYLAAMDQKREWDRESMKWLQGMEEDLRRCIYRKEDKWRWIMFDAKAYYRLQQQRIRQGQPR